MKNSCRVKFNTRVSLVVCPVDDYTSEPRSGGNIHVYLKNHCGKPIRKADGFYVFTDLPEGTYYIAAQSDVYLEEEMTVALETLNPAYPVVYFALKPNSCYPFPGGATLIRGTLRDSLGNAVRGAHVKAVVTSAGCARAKLAQGGLKKGSREVSLANVTGKLAIGDVFFIQEKEEVYSEYCRITGVSGEMQYEIAEALRYDHGRGALLLPVRETRTGNNGDLVVYFRNIKARQFDVNITFCYEDRSKKLVLKVDEGKTNNLGLIRME